MKNDLNFILTDGNRWRMAAVVIIIRLSEISRTILITTTSKRTMVTKTRRLVIKFHRIRNAKIWRSPL